MKTFLPLILALACVYASECVPFAGDVRPRIIGGQNAQRHQFPYVVSVEAANVHFCGGSIVTPSWVLSSGWPFSSMSGTTFDIVAGVLNKNENHPDRQVRTSVEIVVHPEYLFPLPDHDISLIRVSEPFAITAAVKPIQLSYNAEDLQMGTEALTAGWGSVSIPQSPATTLQYLRMSVITLQECRATLGDLAEISDRMICSLPEGEAKGSCSNDHGNPLVQNGILVGVKNFPNLQSCGTQGTTKTPNVFINVNQYLEFTLEHVGDPSSTSSSMQPSGPTQSQSNTTPSNGFTLRPTWGVLLFAIVVAVAKCGLQFELN